MPQELKNLPINEKLLKFIKIEGVVLVYIFGSQVTGFQHQESDVDIGIFLKRGIKPSLYFKKSLRLGNFFYQFFPGKSIHAVILNAAAPFLKHVVIQEGKLIYKKDDFTRVKFEMQTLHEYEDTKHFDEIYYHYMAKRIKEGTFGVL